MAKLNLDVLSKQDREQVQRMMVVMKLLKVQKTIKAIADELTATTPTAKDLKEASASLGEAINALAEQ